MISLGSSGGRSSSTDNTASNAQQDSNRGLINYGDIGGNQTITTTDHGAIESALAANAGVSQSALAANLESTRAALNSNNILAADAFNFGSKALDVNGYTTELALNNNAGVIDTLNEVVTSVLVNGEKATRGALELAGTATTSEAANITELMIKAGVVIGAIAILGAVMARGKK